MTQCQQPVTQLADRPNEAVVVTPRPAASTVDAREREADSVAESLRPAFDGRPVHDAANGRSLTEPAR